MRSIEVHLFETASDVDTAVHSGLVDAPSDFDNVECAACAEQCGEVDGLFHQFALLLDERDVFWFACYVCLEDVLDPRVSTETSLDALFANEDEFETFDLDGDD